MSNGHGNGGHGGNDGYDIELEADYDFEASVDVEFDTSNDYYSDVDISEDICWTPYVEGNSVSFGFNAQAFGDDTLVEVFVDVIAAQSSHDSDGYSSFTATGVVIAM